MRYAQIRQTDIANGPGIRVSLYVQGCNRHCPNCFNEETWDFNGGNPFTDELVNKLIEITNRDHIDGITILGGEPLEPENRKDVLELLKKLKSSLNEGKSIWLYSSFLYEEILKFDENILDYIDVLVDGPFVEDLKDLHLKFKGSSNQRTIDVPASLQSNTIVLHQFKKV
ncbi:MAG: anaerobic ribonucleoside-triphosphate reductase activating protein [Thomasclavelia sp.]|nr:anaerobic ribonucleoside-triphosphate reductase activating protein [Thomasclavelia sp.]